MKLVKLLFAVIALLVVTSVTLSNHSLDDSQKVADLSREIASLEKDITIVRSQIADAGSINAVSSRVEAMGFVSSPKVITLSSFGNVALR